MQILNDDELKELAIDLSGFVRSEAGKRTMAKLARLFDGDLVGYNDSDTMRKLGKRDAYRFIVTMSGDVAQSIVDLENKVKAR